VTEASEIPPGVLANVQRRWPDIAATWAASILSELHALCAQFQATVSGVLPARYGFVVAAESPLGPLVLRNSPDPNSRDQAAVAAALANLGISPRLHQTRHTAHGTWTVLDQVIPGANLNEVEPTRVDPKALFRPLAAMRDQPPPRPGMPSIVDWLRTRLEDDHLADLRPGTAVATDRERSAALDLLVDLIQSHTPALCHGDASSGNIISSGNRGWMYIDPRGMSGDFTYDVAIVATRLTRNHPATEILRDAVSITGLNPDRIRAWAQTANAARV
jgi:streptomycin 6-kinase